MAKKKPKKGKAKVVARQHFTRYAGAEVSRLTADWLTGVSSTNADIRRDLPILRQRSRDLFANNEYAKRFGDLLEQNLIGPMGISYQAQVKKPRGEQEEKANIELERAWEDWGHVGECDVTGGMSFHELCELVATTAAIDGECFVRKVRGYPNKYGFALQIIDSDRLEEHHHDAMKDGGINMSIEVDSWDRPRAYHVLSKHPGDHWIQQDLSRSDRMRIPASDMVHLFRRKRPGQVRGIPWAHAVMMRNRRLGAYEEAEIIAAQIAASKMGFYKPTENIGSNLADQNEPTGGQHPSDRLRQLKDSSPGTFEELPYGYDFQEWKPDHPAGNYAPFVNDGRHGLAVGYNVAHSSLTGELGQVNYSSARIGLLDERDSWRKLQRWFIGSFVHPIYEAWLEQAFLAGKIAITPEQYVRAFTPKWQPRGWDWVDPLKDAQADSEALANGLTTRTKILAAKGEDFEDTMKQLALEKEIAERYGVTCCNMPGAQEQDDNEDAEGENKLRLVHHG